MTYDPQLAARVRRRLIPESGFGERQMFGGLCFLLDGHMCCGINGLDLMLRVHPQDYERLLRRPGVRPMDFTGKPLRGMLYVSPGAISSPQALHSWLKRATSFVRSLPPKSSARNG